MGRVRGGQGRSGGERPGERDDGAESGDRQAATISWILTYLLTGRPAR